MKNELEYARELIDFIYESPTPFHAVNNLKKELLNNEFIELKEDEKWELQKSGRYFVERNNSAMIAFVVGSSVVAKKGFKIVGAHTDCPSFRVKPNTEIISENSYMKLNTEAYGGAILNTWLDRPLCIAGRVTLKSNDILFPRTELVNINRPILIIPNLAIHMNRSINKGVELNKQVDMLPIIGLVNENLERENYLVKVLANELNVKCDEILDFDLLLYEYNKGCIIGLNNEFVSSSRLDDLEMVHAGLTALVNSKTSEATNVLVCFDNEECGSSSKQGADSQILSDVLERIVLAFGGDREDFFRALNKSFMVSSDSAHAVHPNRGEKADPTNRPHINDGPVIKINANQKYASDSNSISVFKEVCKKANVPFQTFVNRSDEVGGSTIGPISANHVAVRTVDIGTALLAMHSIREMCGVSDHSYVERALEEFFNI